MADPIEQHILDQLTENGRMRTKDIIATLPHEARKIKTRLSDMTKAGRIESPKRGTYVLPSTSAHTRPDKTINQISNKLRTAEDNKRTADTLMNIYDDVLAQYKTWIAENLSNITDFEKQLLFIENLKWLTGIGDKLMKRWSLEHVGYDTNTRQAQEDAKAKTAAREKTALEDAPLKDRIVVVGKYDPEAEELIDCIPSSLDKLTDEETDKITV